MKKAPLLVLVLALAVAVVVLSACGTSGTGKSTSGTGTSGSGTGTSGSGTGGTTTGQTAAGTKSVSISNFAFSPDTVDVAVGDTVTWTNDDSVAHTVVGDGGIQSGDLAQGDTYSKKFDSAGTFSYRCSIHPSMTGTVVVK